jgi:hypothetical protein
MPDDPRLRELLAVLESFCVPYEVAEVVIEQAWRIGSEQIGETETEQNSE